MVTHAISHSVATRNTFPPDTSGFNAEELAPWIMGFFMLQLFVFGSNSSTEFIMAPAESYPPIAKIFPLGSCTTIGNRLATSIGAFALHAPAASATHGTPATNVPTIDIASKTPFHTTFPFRIKTNETKNKTGHRQGKTARTSALPGNGSVQIPEKNGKIPEKRSLLLGFFSLYGRLLIFS